MTAAASRGSGCSRPRDSLGSFSLSVGPEVDHRLDQVVDGVLERDEIVTAEGADPQGVGGRLSSADPGLGGETGGDDLSAGAPQHHLVALLGAVHRHGVRRAVAAADRRAQVEIGDLDAGAGQVTELYCVGAAEEVEPEVLDADQVHVDAGDVALNSSMVRV